MSDETKLLRVIVILLVGAALAFGAFKLRDHTNAQTKQQDQSRQELDRIFYGGGQ